MNGGSLWAFLHGASLIDSTHKVNLSRNEEGSENRTQKLLSARGLTWLGAGGGNLHVRSVVSKVLISEAKESGDQWLRQTKAVAQLGTNWWTGGLAWNLTSGRSGKWDSQRGSWKPLHVSLRRDWKPLDPIYPLATCEIIPVQKAWAGVSDGQLQSTSDSATSWAVTCQVSRFVDLPRQEYWTLSFPSPAQKA